MTNTASSITMARRRSELSTGSSMCVLKNGETYDLKTREPFRPASQGRHAGTNHEEGMALRLPALRNASFRGTDGPGRLRNRRVGFRELRRGLLHLRAVRRQGPPAC